VNHKDHEVQKENQKPFSRRAAETQWTSKVDKTGTEPFGIAVFGFWVFTPSQRSRGGWGIAGINDRLQRGRLWPAAKDVAPATWVYVSPLRVAQGLETKKGVACLSPPKADEFAIPAAIACTPSESGFALRATPDKPR